MGLVTDQMLSEGSRLGIWKIEEPSDYFLGHTPSAAPTFEGYHSVRRVASLAARHLLRTLYPQFPHCITDEYGKPFLEKAPFQISISHSHDYAVALSAPDSVGVDIERISPRVMRVAHKFLRPEEKACLDTEATLAHLHVFWGAKEALYKAYGKKGLDFRAHIGLIPFAYTDKGHTTGWVQKGDFYALFTVFFEKMGDYMLVWCREKKYR